MILNKSPSPSEATQQSSSSSDDAQPPSSPSEAAHTPLHNDLTEMSMQEITKSIKTLTSKLEVKDIEIELRNTEIKTAYSTTELLQKRVTELEQRHSDEEHPASGVNSITPASSLLLGDGNLRQILCSDLEKKLPNKDHHESKYGLIKKLGH